MPGLRILVVMITSSMLDIRLKIRYTIIVTELVCWYLNLFEIFLELITFLGIYRQNHLGNNRVQKSQGTCKIGSSCTSQIIINRIGINLNVIYYKFHYCHEKQVQHVRISQDNRTKIASKLQMGVSVDKYV